MAPGVEPIKLMNYHLPFSATLDFANFKILTINATYILLLKSTFRFDWLIVAPDVVDHITFDYSYCYIALMFDFGAGHLVDNKTNKKISVL